MVSMKIFFTGFLFLFVVETGWADPVFLRADKADDVAIKRILDIRDATDFQSVHIPGSLNVKPSFLTRTTLVRHSDVMVVSYGYDKKNVLSRLGDGAQCHVLDGGIAGWVWAGNPVKGDRKKALLVNKKDLFEWPFDTGLLLAYQCKIEKADHSFAYQHLTDSEELSGLFNGYFDGYTPKLFVAESTVLESLMQQLPRHGGRADVCYFLEGGCEAWNEWIAVASHHFDDNVLIKTGDIRPCKRCP